MSEPWSSMQRSKRTTKTTLRSAWRGLLKNELTGPTLLSRWDKRGRGGTENETVKPLDGIQRVEVPHGQSGARRPVASVAVRRATGGCEAYTAKKQAVKIQLRKLGFVAMPTLLTKRKAASGRPLVQGRTGIAGVPSSGHASKGIPHEPRRAHYPRSHER